MTIKTILAEMIAARALLRKGVEEAGHALAKLETLTERLCEADMELVSLLTPDGPVDVLVSPARDGETHEQSRERQAKEANAKISDGATSATWSSQAPESWS